MGFSDYRAGAFCPKCRLPASHSRLAALAANPSTNIGKSILVTVDSLRLNSYYYRLMNENNDNTGPTGERLDLSLAPDWARRDPGVMADRRHSNQRAEGDGTDRFGAGRPGRGNQGRSKPPPRDGFSRDAGPGGRRPAAAARREGGGNPPEARSGMKPGMAGEHEAALPLAVRFIPDQVALATIGKRILSSHQAFPLKHIARLLTDHPDTCRVKIQNESGFIYCCRICGMPAYGEEDMVGHLVCRHLEDLFEAEDVEQPEPKGNFSCVLRCGYSGELLGPPNYHGTGERIKELLRTRFPALTEDAYREKLETIFDTAAIDEWRGQSRCRRIYRMRDTGTAAAGPVAAGQEGMDRSSAEFLLRRDLASQQIARSRLANCPLPLALESPSRGLRQFVRSAWNREIRRPRDILFSLRGALRARKLRLVRVDNPHGPEFVLSRSLSPMDAAHSVESIRRLLEYIARHPGCPRKELLANIGDVPGQSPGQLSSQVTWLADKGHIVEFYNGVLALAEAHPRFSPGKDAGRQRAPSANAGHNPPSNT